MALRTADDYRSSVADGRRIWYQGKQIADIRDEPDLVVALDHAAIDYELAADTQHRDLAVDTDDNGESFSAYYRLPRSADDLRDRSALIEAATAAGGTLVTLVKEIGSDALFALLRVLEDEELERAQAFYDRCRREDLAVAVAQTDVKGDRSKPPHQQDDPDHYVHVVDESSEGIVVRGAKCHTSVATNSDELIVLPTRAMGPDDRDYALSFAVPTNADGLSFYVSAYASGDKDPFESPVSSKHKMLETLTVFDDVFVPWDRVFASREPRLAGPLALTFVEYHRFTAVSYKLPLVDVLVGCAAVVADLNGVAKASHVREKIAQLVIYAESVRGLTHLAAARAGIDQGIAYPDPLTTNLAKYTFATGYHRALELIQDCAGGLLVTGPGGADWASPDVQPVLEKYFAAAGPAEERLRIMNLIADLTTKEFGGYQAVLAIHAEGSIEAEKMQIVRSHDTGRTVEYARHLAGLD